MTRFRILCPRKTETGGPEALHQLGAALIAAGHDAAIVYVPLRRDNRCPPRYLHYGVPVEHAWPDADDMVVVVPEAMTPLLWRLKRARIVLWWLSVDFFVLRPTKWTKRAKLWLRELQPRNRRYAFQPHPRLTHVHHGEHTRRFLVEHGADPALCLTEYIAPALTIPEEDVPVAPRDDVCLFNPRKGLAFAKRAMQACAGLPLRFLPLAGYDEAQLRELYLRSKCYIDFGFHPGRERMPREAAACGCVVVTGRRGSASNAVDVPLPEAYKLDDDAPDVLDRLKPLLQDIMADYPRHRAAQAPYRAWVRDQRRVFHEEARALGERFSASPR